MTRQGPQMLYGVPEGFDVPNQPVQVYYLMEMNRHRDVCT